MNTLIAATQLYQNYNGRIKPPQGSTDFAFVAKGVSRIAVGFSDLSGRINNTYLLLLIFGNWPPPGSPNNECKNQEFQ